MLGDGLVAPRAEDDEDEVAEEPAPMVLNTARAVNAPLWALVAPRNVAPSTAPMEIGFGLPAGAASSAVLGSTPSLCREIASSFARISVTRSCGIVVPGVHS